MKYTKEIRAIEDAMQTAFRIENSLKDEGCTDFVNDVNSLAYKIKEIRDREAKKLTEMFSKEELSEIVRKDFFPKRFPDLYPDDADGGYLNEWVERFQGLRGWGGTPTGLMDSEGFGIFCDTMEEKLSEKEVKMNNKELMILIGKKTKWSGIEVCKLFLDVLTDINYHELRKRIASIINEDLGISLPLEG